MIAKNFINKVANGEEDFLQEFVDILNDNKISFCAIGGLCVNAYAEPVVSLDLDVVIVAEKIEALVAELKKRYRVESFPNSINIFSDKSDLRIQIQTDQRYQDFLSNVEMKDVLG